MHLCASKLHQPWSRLSPNRRQASTWTKDVLAIGPLRTNFNDILLEHQTNSWTKVYLKMSYIKWWPFCLGHERGCLQCRRVSIIVIRHPDLFGQLFKGTHWWSIRFTHTGYNYTLYFNILGICMDWISGMFLRVPAFHWNLTQISMGAFTNKASLVQIMAWRRTRDVPLSEPVMTPSIGAYICVFSLQFQ